MTELTLPRPAAPAPGPLDAAFFDLVEARFRRIVAAHPEAATFVGIHAWDDQLGDGTREAVLGEIDADRAHLGAVEAIDPRNLSTEAAFERELEIHNLRRSLFDAETHRVWERRSLAVDNIGDALFGLFARDFAPLTDRLERLIGRLEAIPAALDQHRSRVVRPQVRLWQQIEIDSAHDLPSFIDEIVAAGRTVLAEAKQVHLVRAAETARMALADYGGWLRGTLASGVDDWQLGREAYDELVRLRSLDGLDADQILELGEQQLAAEKSARIAVARGIDPSTDEPTVVDRLKRDHPATFQDALAGYRDVMVRARNHIIERDLVTIPPDERIEVIPTPEYLCRSIPFAAYFDPPRFDANPAGTYVVTPSVDDDPEAMLEHNWSSISNTSIHEAYPGHHLQLSVGNRHPSLTRFLADAPEFVEGWGMYSEQMMREEGFDDAPRFLLSMHTDGIWRACRILLDVRLQRGEIGVDEAIDFLVRETRFEIPNARAEVRRYTYTPTYQLSYLVGKLLLLGLRADERRRLGSSFSLRDFHDTLLGNGSIPISFHRRLLTAGARGA